MNRTAPLSSTILPPFLLRLPSPLPTHARVHPPNIQHVAEGRKIAFSALL
jgi:hypothetical protein